LAAPFSDPILGEIRPHPVHADAWVCTVAGLAEPIELTIDLDGDPLENCLSLAREAAGNVPTLLDKARSVASDSLLATYNENWRCYREVGPDGSAVDVDNPVLTAAEFEAGLSLKSIRVCGGTMLEFCFADGGLFAGHSVFVISLDGMAFTDTSAELFG
jgi:hypothetical protein